ncbi:matrixin family metalloprotease [Nocardioides sp. zg-1228]|uniref:matrixin family metalloprotease n=1 Tax=Nocardioides sp. zg-1228 TaxID=2763008 RepID=UPI0016433CEA|nr:matrixin family metalloprotease [Nocardioides sp. zg-1228]MBC2931490.1 matrixin family metalloprotease [Nocardioides sp. zg-1228]QSF57096.1 matrixin family metalloprotease [Nocardioides sp. zg-1228]
MSRSSTWLTMLLTATMLAAVVAWHPAEQMETLRRAIGMEAQRPLSAPRVVGQGGAFTWAMTQRGTGDPVGWDPCEEIRYRINPAGEPPGGRRLVDGAIRRISAATGLAFADEGETDERPFPGGGRLFGRPDPVVIGWGDDTEYADLAGQVAGVGGAVAERGSAGHLTFVSGSVVLDLDAFTPAAVAEQPRTMEAIVLHELAHVVGLGHIEEPMELMYADNTGQVELGPGDREGLARLGSLPCR